MEWGIEIRKIETFDTNLKLDCKTKQGFFEKFEDEKKKKLSLGGRV